MKEITITKYLQALPLILLASVFATSANAAIMSLNFEGLQDQEEILDFYNGGTGSMGSSGTNYGINFGSGALGLIDSDAGGTGNFANEPSADTIAFWLSGGGSLLMNVAAGFDTGFSFFYSSSTAGTVNVYSGLGGTGTLLASLNLVAQHADGCTGDPTGTFCNWSAQGVAFAGTAMSVDFGGTADQTGFDNITFGTDNPSVVPVPAAVWLFGTALLGLIGYSKRRKAA